MTIYKEKSELTPTTHISRQSQLKPGRSFFVLQEAFDQEMIKSYGWEKRKVIVESDDSIVIDYLDPSGYQLTLADEEINTHPYNTVVRPLSSIPLIAWLQRTEAGLNRIGFGFVGGEKNFYIRWKPRDNT